MPGGGGPQTNFGSGLYRVENGSRRTTSPPLTNSRVTTMSKPSAPEVAVQSSRSTYCVSKSRMRVRGPVTGRGWVRKS